MKNGWVQKLLEDIGAIKTGSTPKTSEKGNYGKIIPFIKPRDFHTDGSLEYENEGLSDAGLLTARRVPTGSVLMVCIGAAIGKCGITERDVTMNQQVNSLTPGRDVSSRLIYYQMLSEDFQQRVILNSSQMTLPIINKSKWSTLTLILPELPEQQRIVGILDEAFDGIAAAKANAEKNLQNARALHGSLLDAAINGLITMGWRESHPDIEPATVLLRRILAKRRERRKQNGEYAEPRFPETDTVPKIPTGWTYATVEQLLRDDSELSYGILQPGVFDPSGVPMVRVMDIGHGRLNETEIFRVIPKLSDDYICMTSGCFASA